MWWLLALTTFGTVLSAQRILKELAGGGRGGRDWNPPITVPVGKRWDPVVWKARESPRLSRARYRKRILRGAFESAPVQLPDIAILCAGAHCDRRSRIDQRLLQSWRNRISTSWHGWRIRGWRTRQSLDSSPSQTISSRTILAVLITALWIVVNRCELSFFLPERQEEHCHHPVDEQDSSAMYIF